MKADIQISQQLIRQLIGGHVSSETGALCKPEQVQFKVVVHPNGGEIVSAVATVDLEPKSDGGQ